MEPHLNRCVTGTTLYVTRRDEIKVATAEQAVPREWGSCLFLFPGRGGAPCGVPGSYRKAASCDSTRRPVRARLGAGTVAVVQVSEAGTEARGGAADARGGDIAAAAARLRTVALLRDVPEPLLQELASSCAWQRFRTGAQIFDRDSASRDVLFIVEGAVQVVNYSASGREIAYAAVGEGGFLGEISAIDGEPRSATVIASRPCLIAALPPDRFADLLERHPPAAWQVMRRLARIIRTCDERIMDLSTLGAVARVQREILRLARPDPNNPAAAVIHPIPTQQQIAGHASTTRETVARTLGHLQSAGLILRKGRTVTILDVARLSRLTEELCSAGGERAH